MIPENCMSRRDWMNSVSVIGLGAAGCVLASGDRPAGTADVAEIGTRRQLFVDDWLIETVDGVRRRLHQPEKAQDGEPVLLLDRPWEESGTPILGTVLREGERFRMWYRGGGSGPRGGVWCYAESDDGVVWNKPDLNLIEYGGSSQNNIYVLGQPQAYTPFIDPNEPDASRRFKSAVNSLRIDTALAHSPDGLRWTEYRDGAAITGRASDTISQVLWDSVARVYRLYTRTDYGTAETGEVRGTRDMVAAADADLSDPDSWTTVREWCLGWERGDDDYHRQRQLYSVNGWMYEGVQHALIWALETGEGETMNAYMATARDESPWNLEWIYGDQPLIPRGDEGRFDCRWIQPAPNIVTWNDQHWLYYAGQARSHDGTWSPRLSGPGAGIGLARIRRDGFFSLSCGSGGGSITTRALRFEGQRLTINCTTRAQGSVRVELQDARGAPIPGFTLADCMATSGDALDQPVMWKQGDDVSQLAGLPCRLRFALEDADLYSFRFTD